MAGSIDKNDYYYDNIKFILIFIVVLGHYCEKYNESILLNGIFTFIYSFHMPLFIFFSGYFSKKIENQRIKDVKDLLVPYLIIQILYFFILTAANPNYNWSLVLPIGANWYLIGMFIWRLLAPYFRFVKNALLSAILIGLLVGFIPDFNQILNLQRIVSYLPFFILGYNFEGNYKDKLLFKNKIYAVVLFALLIVFYLVSSFHSPEIVSFIKKCQAILYPYNGTVIEKIMQLIERFLFFLLSVVTSIIFMQLIPNKQTIFSGLGKNSLYIFLFHMFFIYFMVAFIPYKSVITELFAIPVSVILTWLLSNKYVVYILRYIIYPWELKEKIYAHKILNK